MQDLIQVPRTHRTPAKETPIKITFLEVPRVVKTLEPFPVTMLVQSTLTATAHVEIIVHLDMHPVTVYGKNTIRFEIDGEQTIQVMMIGLSEGEFTLPKCDIKCGEYQFMVTPTDGVLVIGNRE